VVENMWIPKEKNRKSPEEKSFPLAKIGQERTGKFRKSCAVTSKMTKTYPRHGGLTLRERWNDSKRGGHQNGTGLSPDFISIEVKGGITNFLRATNPPSRLYFLLNPQAALTHEEVWGARSRGLHNRQQPTEKRT